MEDLLAIARRQIDIFIEVQTNDELPYEFAQVRRSSNDVSHIHSSRYIVALDAVCAQLIAGRGARIWEILHRCITTGRVEYSRELAERLKLFSTPYLSGTVGGLTERAAKESRLGVQPRESEAARVRAIATLEAEIDLFCAVLARAPQPAQYQPPNVFNIHGSSVASLQTGNHSSATVTTVSVSSQHPDVAAAVAALKAELHAANIDGAPILLVEEMEAELTKATPQRSRLKGFVDAVGSCVRGAIDVGTKLPDAVEGAKRAIEMLPM